MRSLIATLLLLECPCNKRHSHFHAGGERAAGQLWVAEELPNRYAISKVQTARFPTRSLDPARHSDAALPPAASQHAAAGALGPVAESLPGNGVADGQSTTEPQSPLSSAPSLHPARCSSRSLESAERLRSVSSSAATSVQRAEHSVDERSSIRGGGDMARSAPVQSTAGALAGTSSAVLPLTARHAHGARLDDAGEVPTINSSQSALASGRATRQTLAGAAAHNAHNSSAAAATMHGDRNAAVPALCARAGAGAAAASGALEHGGGPAHQAAAMGAPALNQAQQPAAAEVGTRAPPLPMPAQETVVAPAERNDDAAMAAQGTGVAAEAAAVEHDAGQPAAEGVAEHANIPPGAAAAIDAALSAVPTARKALTRSGGKKHPSKLVTQGVYKAQQDSLQECALTPAERAAVFQVIHEPERCAERPALLASASCGV